MAGAKADMIEKAVAELIDSGEIRFPKAQEIVKKMQG